MKPQSYSLRALRASASVTVPRRKLSRVERVALREKNAKGSYVAPELRHESAERVISAVIRRIEWPRHGSPVTLSATDKADAMAAGMLACVQARFFDHGIMGIRILRAIRNAIQGPECLRMRRTWEGLTDSPADVAAQVGFITEFEETRRTLAQGQRDMAREIMRTLRAAFTADGGRQRIGNFRSQRGFFLTVLGELTGKGARAMTPEAFRQRARRFLDYLSDGAEALRAKRTPPRLDLEILRALELRALA
jgi:hypothetical protein